MTKHVSPALETELAAIEATFTEYISAWKAADAARIASLYCDDAVFLPANHSAETSRPAIMKINKNFFAEFTPGSFEISMEDRILAGDWAFERGTYQFTAMPNDGGQLVADRGRYVVILQRQADGSWRWLWDMENSDGLPRHLRNR